MKKRILTISILSIFLLTSFISCSSRDLPSDGNVSMEELSVPESSSTGMVGGLNKGDLSVESQEENSNVDSTLIPNSNATLPENNRKIINRAELFIETLEFEKSITQLESTIKSFSGYIESSNILQDGIVSEGYKQNRFGEFIIRIPQEKFQSFLLSAGDMGVITNKRIFGEDISSQYYDREARLKVLQAQEKKYLSLLDNAKDIKEILEIERALTEVRYEIESLTGYLKQMDNLVSYSTINLNITEVTEARILEETPKTFGDKIVKVFTDSIKSLKTVGIAIVLSLVAILPYAIIFTVLGYIIYFVIKKYKIKKR